jgi:hypothetical protein
MNPSSGLTRALLSLAFLAFSNGHPGRAAPLFPNPQFVTGSETLRAVSGDFNRDGRLDLAVSSRDGSITVFAGEGDGSFSRGVILGSGGAALAVDDFNGDGLADVAAVDGVGVVEFRGHGDGTFEAGLSTSVPSGTIELAAGDLNADGRVDLVVVVSQGVHTLLGQADGTFAVQPLWAIPDTTRQVALGDFDQDGRLDLALTVYNSTYETSHIMVMRGNGDGTFVHKAAISGPGNPVSLAVGDLDADGLDDIAVVRFASGGYRLDLSFSAGDWSFTQVGPLASAYHSVSIGDQDGDGRADLVTNTFGILRVLVHSGPRSFVALPDQPSCAYFNTLGDFNGDGRIDVVMTSDDSTVYLGRGDGTVANRRIDVGLLPYSVAWGEFNGDGRPDLVAAVNGLEDYLAVLLGQDGLAFDPPLNFPVDDGVNSVAVCDFDGDGRQDVASVGTTGFPGSLSVHFGNGDGTLLPAVGFDATGRHPIAVICGDVNHDARGDLVVVEFDADAVSVILGRADRVLGPETRYPTGAAPVAAALGDLDGDGNPDLVVAGSSIAVFAGSGDGTFTPGVDITGVPSTTALALADLDLDGHLDLAVASPMPGEVACHFGRGDGTFEARQVIGSAVRPSAIVAGDVNRDGLPDVLVANTDPEHFLSVQLNAGGRAFRPSLRYALCRDSHELTLADFNGDGGTDIAAATFTGVSVLLNHGPAEPDTDGDGVGDGTDNCVYELNAGQSDQDADGAGDVCDCLPEDASAFAVPGEVSAVVLEGDAIAWDSAALAAGSGTVYDVVRAGLHSQPPGSGPGEVCLAQGITTPATMDASVPPSNDGYWYLVRARNACGAGSYGTASNGTPRITDACP